MNYPIILSDARKDGIIAGLNQKDEVIRVLREGGDVHNSISNKVFCCVLNKSCSFSAVEELGEKGKVGIPYLLEINGKKYVAKVSDYSPRFELQTIKNREVSGRCFSDKNKQPSVSLGLDEYTNEVIIGYVVTNCMEENGMIKDGHDFAITQSTSSICKNKGVNITPYMSYGSLGNIATSKFLSKYREEYSVVDPIDGTVLDRELVKSDIIRTIISQVVTAIHRLSTDIQFSSGDLKPDNIFLSPEETKGSYQTLNVSGPFKCKIGDFGKSSCSVINNREDIVRIYNANRAADLYFYFQSFKPNIHSDPVVKGGHYYIIDNLTVVQVYAVMRHNTSPYYRYFDYYMFMVTFLSIPEIYYSFFGTASLTKKFWQSMWISKADADSVQLELRKYALATIQSSNKKMSAYDAIDLLRNRRLRCSIVDYILAKDPILYY